MVGRNAIVIAHRLSTARALDRVLVFGVGRIVEDGLYDGLLAVDDGHYRSLFERQSGASTPEVALPTPDRRQSHGSSKNEAAPA